MFICIVIGFNLIAHTLWGNYFCTTEVGTTTKRTDTIKTGNVLNISWSTSTSRPTILITKAVWNEKAESKPIETPIKKPTKPILTPRVSAWYDGETEYERVRNQIIKLWLTYEQAETIVREWYANTSWWKQFVKAIIWVASSEWWMFKHGLYNNYLWVMYNGSLRHYATFWLAIEHRRQLYNKNKRYLNTDWQDWLNRHYCVWACSSWVSNYNAWIYLLNI